MLSARNPHAFSNGVLHQKSNGHIPGGDLQTYTDHHRSRTQEDMNHLINKYFHDQVQLVEKEAKGYRKVAFDNVERILAYINQKDPRFSRNPVRAGSYWQGLKVDKADEYDYSVVMAGMPKLQWTGDRPRYYGFDKMLESIDSDTLNLNLNVVKMTVPLPSPPKAHCFMAAYGHSWSRKDDLVREGDLVPILVKRRLKELLTQAIRDLDLRGEVHQSRKIHGPALTVYFKTGQKKISIDFAPLVQSRVTIPSWMGWPRRTQWPDAAKIENIKRFGVSDVAKKDFYWMYSFVEAEKELVADIDNDGGKRKEVHRVMKKLNGDVWCNTTKPVISSYILKNIWFWEIEKHPNSWDWDNDHLWTRLRSMTQELLRCIQDRKLQQYFFPDNDLMKGKDTEQLDIAARKIQSFLENPAEYLEVD